MKSVNLLALVALFSLSGMVCAAGIGSMGEIKKEIGNPVGGEFSGKSMLKANQMIRAALTGGDVERVQAVIDYLKKAGGKRAIASAMQWQKALEKAQEEGIGEGEEQEAEGEAAGEDEEGVVSPEQLQQLRAMSAEELTAFSNQMDEDLAIIDEEIKQARANADEELPTLIRRRNWMNAMRQAIDELGVREPAKVKKVKFVE
jgi:hypothetical protein